MMKPEFMSDDTDPSVREWQRIMAARAHGYDGGPECPHSEVTADCAVSCGVNEVRTEDLGDLRLHPSTVITVGDPAAVMVTPDVVNMPSHYTQLPVEAIDITEHFNFCMGNALKYIWRADHKGKPVEDLRKAAWYIQREIERRERDGR